jgi:hypothetical protein
MTELTPPNPIPGGTPAPEGTPAPTEPAKKKGSTGKIISTVFIVLVVLGGLFVKFGLPYLEASKFEVGTCLDVDLDTPDGSLDEINAVDCSSADAKSKIIAIFDGTVDDTDRLCPDNAIAGVQRDDKLFCVVYN